MRTSACYLLVSLAPLAAGRGAGRAEHPGAPSAAPAPRQVVLPVVEVGSKGGRVVVRWQTKDVAYTATAPKVAVHDGVLFLIGGEKEFIKISAAPARPSTAGHVVESVHTVKQITVSLRDGTLTSAKGPRASHAASAVEPPRLLSCRSSRRCPI